MSDRALSSDEDEPKKPIQFKGPGVKGSQHEQASSVQEAALSSSSDEMPTETQKVITSTIVFNVSNMSVGVN